MRFSGALRARSCCRRITVGLVISAAACQEGEHAARACAHLPVGRLLELEASARHLDVAPPGAVEFDSLPFSSAADRATLYSARWYGPDEGVLLLVSCQGEVFATLNVGFVKSLRAGPHLAGASVTAFLTVTPEGGTGHELERLLLVARAGDRLTVGLSELTYERDESMPLREGNEKVSRLRFSAGYDTLELTSVEARFRRNSVTDSIAVRVETARTVSKRCWIEARVAFLDCQ